MTNTDRAGWTIAYRKRTANRFLRVSTWQGTWAQAVALSSVFTEANPDLQVWYVPTVEAEQQGGDPADIGNVMVDSGKRIKIVESDAMLPAEILARVPSAEIARERWHSGAPIANPAPKCDTVSDGVAQVEQIEAWWARHNLSEGETQIAERILAARAADHDEALVEQQRVNREAHERELAAQAAHTQALAIAASIPIDGRPAEVTAMLEAAELLTDERENLAALQHARKVYDEHLAALPVHYMGADLLDACGGASATDRLIVTPVSADVTCPACRNLLGRGEADDRGLRMGPGHVAPATVEAARDEALKVDGKFVITFDRVGARRYGEALTLTLDRELLGDADEIARAVHSHARRYVTSRHFEVEADVEAGRVLIEGGRFGRGTFTPDRAPAVVPSEATPGQQLREYPPFADVPLPRADRLALAFTAFNEQADSGGPGTSRGLIAAVELASTVTVDDLTRMQHAAGVAFARQGRGVPSILRHVLREALAAVGIAVE